MLKTMFKGREKETKNRKGRGKKWAGCAPMLTRSCPYSLGLSPIKFG